MRDIKIVIKGEVLEQEQILAAIKKAIADDPEIFKPKIVVFDPDEDSRIVRAIRELTKAECSSVIIHHPNPEMEGPNQVIETSLSYESILRRFEGDSLLDCLNKALAFQGKAIV